MSIVNVRETKAKRQSKLIECTEQKIKKETRQKKSSIDWVFVKLWLQGKKSGKLR